MKIDIKDKISFDIDGNDLPNEVLESISNQLNEQTNGYIIGVIREYDEPIESYETPSIASMLSMNFGSRHVDIQNKLGAQGEDYKKYEFCIEAKFLPNYKFRLLFIGFRIGGYPCKLVLEESIADEINKNVDCGYIYTINDKNDLEDTIAAIMGTNTFIRIIQEIITASNRNIKRLEKKDSK